MPKYNYTVRLSSGSKESGEGEAASREALVIQLRSQNKYVITVREQSETGEKLSKLKLKDLPVFCRQMAAMLTTGINMTRALETIIQANVSKRVKAACKKLVEGVMQGQNLSESMKSLGNVFPPLLIYMTETGETSGTLDIIMGDMAIYYQKDYVLKKKVKTALIYPIILGVVSIIVVLFLLTYVMPIFINMYQGVDLPIPTKMLLALSDFVVTKWLYIIIFIGAVTGLFLFLNTVPAFRVWRGKTALNIWVFGKLNKTIITSRFASTFAILYASGVSVLKSMDIVTNVMTNDYVKEQLSVVGARIQQGTMLSEAFRGIHIFDPMLYTTIGVGEESGRLESMLKDSGEYFAEESETALNQMVAMIEPMMIVVFGFIVGFIVIAIMMPIFGMYQQIM